MNYKNKYRIYKSKYKSLISNVNSSYNHYGGGQSHLIAVYPPVQRIIAIGDLHGDSNAMFRALRLANIIDQNDDWIGGNTYVVQVGDILDCDRGGSKKCGTGAEEIEILDFLFQLNQKAQKKGGRVINILGNHELMNVLGNFRYASPQHTLALGGEQLRKSRFRPGGDLALKMAVNMQPVVKIGNYIFVHGSILPHHLDKDTPKLNETKLQQMIDVVADYLRGHLSLEQMSSQYPDLIRIIDPRSGEMFWNRELSTPHSNVEQCQKADNVLDKLGSRNGAIIMGHTVHDEITSACDKKLWKIDIGMSEGFEGHSKIQVLQILDNKRVSVLD